MMERGAMSWRLFQATDETAQILCTHHQLLLHCRSRASSRRSKSEAGTGVAVPMLPRNSVSRSYYVLVTDTTKNHAHRPRVCLVACEPANWFTDSSTSGTCVYTPINCRE
jgi:hypothetical protein